MSADWRSCTSTDPCPDCKRATGEYPEVPKTCRHGIDLGDNCEHCLDEQVKMSERAAHDALRFQPYQGFRKRDDGTLEVICADHQPTYFRTPEEHVGVLMDAAIRALEQLSTTRFVMERQPLEEELAFMELAMRRLRAEVP